MPQEHKPTYTPTLDQAIREFLLDGRARQFTPRTLDHYRGRLTKFAVWAATLPDAPTHPAEVTPAHVRAYLVHLQERGLASNTQHTEARVLRAFINFCTREGWLTISPFVRVKMPKADKIEKPALDADEVRRLVKACASTRDRALLLTMLDTGLRATEVCSLNVGDVDLDRLTVTVKLGKGRKDRTGYIGAKTARQVGKYLSERNGPPADAPLFASASTANLDGRLTRSGLRRVLETLGRAAGVKVHPHKLRRTFAIEALRNGMNLYALAELMGHADLATLRRYLAIVGADLKSAHRAAGPVDNLLK